MRCNRCNRPNPAGARYCAGCGNTLSRTCPACGTPAMDDASFCIECGSFLDGAPPADAAGSLDPLHIDGTERRQLTVVFCDLVGSTGLARLLDPEDLRELNRAYRQFCANTIGRYDGYVARYMGDGVLAYFGYPRAHEDDALRAVHAGLELAAGAPSLPAPGSAPLAVRVGIATGEVVVGELVGEGDARERDVVGETPNLAARLQGLAAANEVVIAEGTRRLVGSAFHLDDLGPQLVKGFDEPVAAWRVAGTATGQTRFEAAGRRFLTPFVGREHESAPGSGMLAQGDGRPRAGRPPGRRAGNRQVPDHHDAARASRRQRPVAVRCQCSSYHSGSALYPVIEHLQRAAAFSDGDTPDEQLAKLSRVLGNGETASLDLALVASLMSLPSAVDDPVRGLDADALRERTLEALARSLESIAVRKPLLVLFEDMQWSDPTTTEFIGFLVERIRRWRALLMVTFRPEFVPPWFAEAHVSLVTLNRLDRSQCDAMVTALAGGKPVPVEIVEEIVARTDGVPLFVEELTRTILESDMVVEDDGVYRIAGTLQTLAIPETLQDSLMARLDHLDDAKLLAQIGAAIGREFSLPLLMAVSGYDQSAVSAALSRLVESGLVQRRGVGARGRFVFRHALVRDAAYNSMLKSRRIALHGRIAQVLRDQFADVARTQPEILARHYQSAAMPGEALKYWLDAGERAMAQSAYREAISHFRQALACLSDSRGTDDEIRAVEVRISIAGCLRVVDRIDEAFEELAEAERAASGLGLDRLLARICHQRGNLYFPMARTDECLAEHSRALEYSRCARSIGDEVRAPGGLGDAHYVRGRMRTAKRFFAESVEIARRHGFDETVAANLPMVGFSRSYLLELREALADGVDGGCDGVRPQAPARRFAGDGDPVVGSVLHGRVRGLSRRHANGRSP
ncbi:MAG: zinc ribbon domain-containing protein [Gammaproteobacteria bacterium]|nr:zinc ribbon domain-containing protein [Gammaproteobacteria bacterium]